MFSRGDRVAWVCSGEITEYLGTVRYAYTIWNAPTMRSDSFTSIDLRLARYIVLWDDGTQTHCEFQDALTTV